MKFVGIDPAASKGIALVSIEEGVLPDCRTSQVFKLDPPKRLAMIREWVYRNTAADTACVLVEQQFNGRVLPAVAAVCVEAAQAKAPGAVVLEMTPSQWRKALSGSGRMTKDDALDVAEHLGAPRQDDIAEALCMAMVARRRWMAAIG